MVRRPPFFWVRDIADIGDFDMMILWEEMSGERTSEGGTRKSAGLGVEEWGKPSSSH